MSQTLYALCVVYDLSKREKDVCVNYIRFFLIRPSSGLNTFNNNTLHSNEVIGKRNIYRFEPIKPPT